MNWYDFNPRITIMVVLLFIILFLYVSRITLENKLSIEDSLLTELQTENATLYQENQTLKIQKLQYEAYTNIASEAASMGFKKAQTIWLGQ